MLINANALSIPLADKSVHCVVTSPPYWGLRDYGVGGQLGLERTPEEYVANMVQVFRECWRVLRDDGTLWLNIGDSYNSNASNQNNGRDVVRPSSSDRYSNKQVDTLKPKDLVGIPWRVAFALQADGWYLRSDIIWAKPNPMPESVTDRPTKAHEYLFLLAKRERYYYDAEAVREDNAPGGFEHNLRYGDRKRINPNGNSRADDGYGLMVMPGSASGRNRRTVWTIPTAPYSGAHFATYPPALVEPCIKAGTSERGVCPVCGMGWRRWTQKQGGIPGSKQARIDEGIIRYHENGAILHMGGNPQRPPSGGFAISFTLGWQPACTCDAGDPIPATVFDPFAGSGTTLMVARSLGRRGVGLDLSYRYLYDNARTRLELDRLDAWHNGATSSASELSDLPMFAEVK